MNYKHPKMSKVFEAVKKGLPVRHQQLSREQKQALIDAVTGDTKAPAGVTVNNYDLYKDPADKLHAELSSQQENPEIMAAANDGSIPVHLIWNADTKEWVEGK